MSTPQPTDSRLEFLERRCGELEGLVHGLLGRLAAPHPPPVIYPAQAIAGENPDSESPLTFPKTGNTFLIRLVDRVFTPSPGTQSTDDSPRTAQQFAAARTVDGRWVYDNDFVLAVHAGQPPGTEGDKGEWWLIDPRRIEIVVKTSNQRDEDSGYFPGKLLHFDPLERELTPVADIWIEDANAV